MTNAFAVYSDTDHSLDFYKRDEKPVVGEMFNGKKVTNVYYSLEKQGDSPSWSTVMNNIQPSTVVDSGIKPYSISYWYSSATNLTTVKGLDKLGISELWNNQMVYVFGSCSSLVEVQGLSSWDTSKVKAMAGMFHKCSSLKSLDISGWKTSSVTTMQFMFDGCSNLSLNCSGWDVSSVGDFKSGGNTNFNYNAPGVIAPNWVN